MIRQYISKVGFLCIMIALLMALILLIAGILQHFFYILEDCIVFEEKYMILIIILAVLGVISSIIDMLDK